MPERDAFADAYARLASTRLAGPPATAPGPVPGGEATRDLSSPVRWAASGLLTRLDGLAPKRRMRRFRPAGDD